MSKKKIVAVIVSLGLIAAIGIGATLAYLTATTETLENTFTVGNVKMSIWENDNKNEETDTKYGTVVNKETDKEYTFTGNNYELLPAQSADKKPYVQVDQKDIEVWVFAKIDGIADLAEQGITVSGFDGATWYPMSNQAVGEDGIYGYKAIVTSEDNDTLKAAKLFTTVTYSADAEGGEAEDGGKLTFDETLTIKGACIQASGFEDITAAYAEAASLF